jgi:competence protein ComEA
MIMKKKIVITGIIVGLFIMAGVCYSCSYKDSNESAVLVNSLEKNGEEIKTENTAELNKSESVDNPAQIEEPVKDPANNASKSSVYIHLCGAVVNPGVYEVKATDRLFDVIELAGGLNQDAAGDYINQAQTIIDGQRIYIPTVEEVKEIGTDELIEGETGILGEPTQDDSLININTADKEALMSLTGVGQAKADSIIEYRSKNGNFKSIEELMNIPGIKEGLFNQISSYITVN